MNKNVKKFFYVILCAVIALTIFTVTGYAQEKAPVFRLSVDSKAEVGNKVRLFVSVDNMPEFSQADFRVSFDSSNLECLAVAKSAVSNADIWGDYYNNNFGVADCTFATYENVQGSQNIAFFVFNVLDTENTIVTVSVTGLDCEEAPEDVKIDIKSAEISVPLQFDYDYEIKDSEVIINSCNRNAVGEIIIPSTIEGYPVTTIKKHAFSVCSKVSGVVIPDTVTTIEDSAFSTCDSLTSVTIGSGVRNLGSAIFWSCENLENVIIKDGVTVISEKMFSMCQKLKNVTLPDSIVSIGHAAFDSCYLLRQIKLPDSLKKIEKSAFYMCKCLDNVVIPDSVTEIPEFAFYECEILKTITLSDNLTEIGNLAFSGSALQSVSIPSTVKNIGESAFAHTNLKKIVIPEGITKIAPHTFSGCKNLTDVIIPLSVQSIERYAFLDCYSLKSIRIPSSVTEIGYMAVGYAEFFPVPMDHREIHGIAGSAAERYANENRIKFIAEDNDFVYSDVNADGKVSAADARLALRAAAKLENLEGAHFNAADVDQNGIITASDARKILRRAAKLE